MIWADVAASDRERRHTAIGESPRSLSRNSAIAKSLRLSISTDESASMTYGRARLPQIDLDAIKTSSHVTYTAPFSRYTGGSCWRGVPATLPGINGQRVSSTIRNILYGECSTAHTPTT